MKELLMWALGKKEQSSWINPDFVLSQSDRDSLRLWAANTENLEDYLNLKLAIYRAGGYKYNLIPINLTSETDSNLDERIRALLQKENFICSKSSAISGFVCTAQNDAKGLKYLNQIYSNYINGIAHFKEGNYSGTAQADSRSGRLLGENSHLDDIDIAYYQLAKLASSSNQEEIRSYIFDWHYEDYIKLFPSGSLTEAHQQFIQKSFSFLTDGRYAIIRKEKQGKFIEIIDPKNSLGKLKPFLEASFMSIILRSLQNIGYRAELTKDGEKYDKFIPFSAKKLNETNDELTNSIKYLNEHGAAHLLGLTPNPEQTYNNLVYCIAYDKLAEYQEILLRIKSATELSKEILLSKPEILDQWNIAHYIFTNNHPELFAEIIDIISEKQFLDLLVQKNQQGKLPLEYASATTFKLFAEKYSTILGQHLGKQIMASEQNNYVIYLLENLKNLAPETQEKVLSVELGNQKQNIAHCIFHTKQHHLLNYLAKDIVLKLVMETNNKGILPLEYATAELKQQYLAEIYWQICNAIIDQDPNSAKHYLEKLKTTKPEILQQILSYQEAAGENWNLAHCAILNEMPEILNKIAEIADDKVVVKLLNTPNKAAQYPMQLNDVTNGLIKFLMSKPLDSIYFQPIFAEGNTLLHFIDPNIFKNLDPENVTSAQIAFMNLIHKMPNPDEFLSVKNAAGETVYDKIDGLKEYVTEMKTRDFSWIDQCPKRDLNDIVREIQAKEACPHLTAGHIGKIVTSDSKALWAEHSGQNIGYLGLGH